MKQGLAGKSLKILLTEPWFSYDTYYYFQIVSAGYQGGEITSIYHPLYPRLSTLAAALVRSPIAGLVIVSSIAGLGLTIVFYRFARLDVDHTLAWTATALLLCWPGWHQWAGYALMLGLALPQKWLLPQK